MFVEFFLIKLLGTQKGQSLHPIGMRHLYLIDNQKLWFDIELTTQDRKDAGLIPMWDENVLPYPR